MVGTTSNWEDELRGWLKPFLDRLGHKSRRQMFPLYVSGLIGPAIARAFSQWRSGSRCEIRHQSHDFIAAGVSDAAPVETELLVRSGPSSSAAAMPCWLIIDTAHSSEGCAFGGCCSRSMLRHSARPPIARRWCR